MSTGQALPRLWVDDYGWAPTITQVWSEDFDDWGLVPFPENAGVKHRSLFSPYIADGTVLTRSVADMPLAANSADIAQWAWDITPLGFGDKTALNKVSYNIPIYVVDSTVPGCHFQQMTTGGVSAGSRRETYLNGLIPLPAWATAAGGGDGSLSLYDVGTGIMREYFLCENVATDIWTCTTGGYYLAKKGLVDLAQTNYAMQLTEGSSAVVRMLNPLAQIGIAEARMGRINHAISFTCANAKQNITSWPALDDDGTSTDADAFAEGQWFRIPESVDPRYSPAGVPWLPMTRVLIQACKEYGGFSADKNLFVHAFNVEAGNYETEFRGQDPWASGGDVYEKYAAHPAAIAGDPLSIKDFPWYLTEWAPIDWGKPA